MGIRGGAAVAKKKAKAPRQRRGPQGPRFGEVAPFAHPQDEVMACGSANPFINDCFNSESKVRDNRISFRRS